MAKVLRLLLICGTLPRLSAYPVDLDAEAKCHSLVSLVQVQVKLGADPKELKVSADHTDQVHRHEEHKKVEHHNEAVMTKEERKKEEKEAEAKAERKKNPISVPMSCTLLGAVVLIMVLFYYVNSPNRAVASGTWMVVSNTLSIYCSILVFHIYRSVWIMIDGEDPESLEVAVPKLRMVAWNLARFLVLQLILWYLLWALQGRSSDMQACGSMGAHIVGFAAIDVFGGVQQTKMFRQSPFSAGLDAILTICLLGCGYLCIGVARTHCFGVGQHAGLKPGRKAEGSAMPHHGKATAEDQSPSQHDHSEGNSGGAEHDVSSGHSEAEEFCEVCAEGENESAALCVGRVIEQTIEFACCGSLAKLENVPKGHSDADVTGMSIACVIVFGVLVAAVTLKCWCIRQGYGQTVRRAATIFQSTIAMTLGWTLVYWEKWYFWNATHDVGVEKGDVVLARTVMFALFFCGAFILILIIAWAGDRKYISHVSVSAFVTVLGLGLGLAWESVISVALQGLSVTLSQLNELLLHFSLAAAVIPAWKWYILPHAIAAEHMEHHHEEFEVAKASTTVG